jgi:hypothetical protein
MRVEASIWLGDAAPVSSLATYDPSHRPIMAQVLASFTSSYSGEANTFHRRNNVLAEKTSVRGLKRRC